MKNEEGRITLQRDNAAKFFILHSSFFIYLNCETRLETRNDDISATCRIGELRKRRK